MKNFLLILIALLCSISSTIAGDTEWWNKYGDEVLTASIEKIYIENPDLKIAALKTKQMQEVVKMSFANELPQVGFDASIGRELRSSDMYFGKVVRPNYSQTRFLLPLSMSYEVDLYGKNHLQTKSFKNLSEMTLQDEKMARIMISGSFTANYFNLIKLDSLIENQKKLVELQEKISSMERIKYEKGLCGKAEMLTEQQAYASFKEDLNDMLAQQEIIKNQMIAMLGDKKACTIERSKLESIKTFEIPEQLSSDVITKRPDFIKSELYVKKTGVDVKVARRELLPTFTLYGNIGFNAYDLNRMFTGNSLLSGIGILPSLDIFTGGRKMANLRYKKLECKKAVEMYNKTILTSIQELNDSLYRIKTSRDNYRESLTRYGIEEEKFDLTQKKLKIGATSLLEELKEQRNLYLRENETTTQKANYLVMTIELYKALGGQDFTDSLL